MSYDPKPDLIARLRELTGDRPSHARLLEVLLSLEDDSEGQDEDYAAGAMAESTRLSATAAQALVEDVSWIRHYVPRGYSVFPNQYAEYRRRGAAAARARSRTLARRANEPSLAELLNLGGQR